MPARRGMSSLLMPAADTTARRRSEDEDRYGPLERQRADSAAIMNAARAYLGSADASKETDLANAYAAAERGRAGTMFGAQVRNMPEYQGLANQARRERDSTQFVNNAAFQRMVQLSEQKRRAEAAGAAELSRERAGLPGADASKVYDEEQRQILEALGIRLRPRG